MSTAPHPQPTALTRRGLLGLALVGATTIVAGCVASTSSPQNSTPSTTATPMTNSAASEARTQPRVLIAYFSRAGENYDNGDRTWLSVGNTEVLVGLIAASIRAAAGQVDVHRIEAADPYPDAYDPTVARNIDEQNRDARPAVTNPLASVEGFDVILLASPIWNTRAPMIMTTFTEALDFTGATVHPVTTHAMSGLGSTSRDYARSCRGATIGDGLAVRGEQVRDATPQVQTWLRSIRLTPQ